MVSGKECRYAVFEAGGHHPGEVRGPGRGVRLGQGQVSTAAMGRTASCRRDACQTCILLCLFS